MDIQINKKELYQTAFAAGVLGSFVILVTRGLAQVLGFTGMNIGLMVGTLFTGDIDGMVFIGFPIQVFLFAVFSLAYAPAFFRMGRASTRLGALFGLVQWLVVGVLFGVLSDVHPMMPDPVPAPGYFALSASAFEVVFLLALNVGYGAIVGYFCEPIIQRAKLRKEMRDEVVDRRAV